MAKDDREYDTAMPVRELAAGEVVLRQLPGSGALFSKKPAQSILPLGKLMLLGYSVAWDSDGFALKTPGGEEPDTTLEGARPTISEEQAVG